MAWHRVVMKYNAMSHSEEGVGNGRANISRAANENKRHPKTSSRPTVICAEI
jgi:hypothetical protein